MRPSLHPRLINGPFDDPGLYIDFISEKYAILFDLGEIDSLSSKDILKISHVFVTHTHIDHFSGFDRLIRLFLGQNRTLSFYGPQGFISNVAGKLAGYSWNLVNRYDNSFSLNIIEIHPDSLIRCRFSCQNRFLPETPVVEPFNAVLVETPGWIISAVILDHGIPCLAFSIQEKFHVNIKKDRLESMGLEVGPWITDFKQALFAGSDPSSIFQLFDAKHPGRHISYELGNLSMEIATITPGQKITYITDAVFSNANIEKMVNLSKGSDHLFIEATFMESTHRQIAEDKYHLTAWQAGTLAALAKVRQFTIFHHSPRYTGQEYLLTEEAIRAYNIAVNLHDQ